MTSEAPGEARAPEGLERAALAEAAARLERVAAAIEAAPAEELGALADEAVALSGEIADRLPRVLREAEAAGEDRRP
ncbi:MAG: hypothetical protein QOD86_2958 [Miltoncostaeaceae bacterium]|jgi:hypothetical protein|nr:hypothetical protein [Miltoncostaeaceae bacterium]